MFVGLNGGRDEEGGWDAGIGPGLELQPSARLQTSLSANYSVGQDVAQWITNRDVNGDGETDHVYGRLRRDVIDVTARATYAFHRDMTLEVFLQPFVAVGEYSDIRRLARPSSFEFEPATIPFDPNFNSKSNWRPALFLGPRKAGLVRFSRQTANGSAIGPPPGS